MEKVTLNTMLGSDYHRIVAQVLEIVEKTEFKPGKDVNILETGVEGVWKIVIPKKDTSLDELQSIKTQLGGSFNVNVAAKDKVSISISLEAPSEAFMQLVKKPLQSRPMGQHQEGTLIP